MSTKYNISSLINKKQILEKEDEDDQNKNKVKTVNTNENTDESDELKNKSLNEVFEDLDKIKTDYSTKDKVDAPSELDLSLVEVPNKSEEELLELLAIVPEDMVVICTGRHVPERIKECADELYQVTLEK